MCFVVHGKGKATGLAGAVEWGQVGSCKQLSVMFLEMEPCLQGWGQDIDLALRETETGQAIVTAEEHAIYKAETSPLGGCVLEFTLFSYLLCKWLPYKYIISDAKHTHIQTLNVYQ